MSSKSDTGANRVQLSIMGTAVNLGANLRDEDVQKCRQAIAKIETRISELYYRGQSLQGLKLAEKTERELFAAMLLHYEAKLTNLETRLTEAERNANVHGAMLSDLLESLEAHLMDEPLAE